MAHTTPSVSVVFLECITNARRRCFLRAFISRTFFVGLAPPQQPFDMELPSIRSRILRRCICVGGGDVVADIICSARSNEHFVSFAHTGEGLARARLFTSVRV